MQNINLRLNQQRSVLLTLFALLMFPTVGMAKSPTVSLENASWEAFSNRSRIQALALLEAEQTLWVGSRGGLEKRDANTGELIKILTHLDHLPHIHVTALVTDDRGGLWVGTEDQLSYRNAQDEWAYFDTNHSGLPGKVITNLATDGKGGVWLGTVGGGLAHLKNTGEWTVFNTDNSGLPSNEVWGLATDNEGGLWVGTIEGGLAYLDKNGHWQVLTTDNSALPSNHVVTLMTDSNGLWVGTMGGGIALLSHSGEWQRFNTENSDLPHNEVFGLAKDGSNGIWVSTWGAGLAHFDGHENWLIFDQDNSDLPYNQLKTILNDSRGGLWVGTWGYGMAHFNGRSDWQVFNENSLPKANTVSTLANDGNGGLWVGTHEGGFAHLKSSGEWQQFNLDQEGFLSHDIDVPSLPSNQVKALVNDNKGGVWVGTLGGLAHLSHDAQWQFFNVENSDLPDNTIFAMVNEGHGGVWLGTGNGLVHLDADNKWTIFHPENSGLPNKVVNALANDGNGGLWVGTWEFGLSHFNAAGEWRRFDVDNSGLPSNKVSALENDGDGGVWVSTADKGLARLNKREEWKIVNTDNSELPNGAVNDLVNDGDGGLWIATSNGLAHLTALGDWTVFNRENSGLPENGVLALASDGYWGLWVGSFGLSHLTFGQQLTGDLSGKRAAMLIYPNSRGGKIKHLSTEEIAGYAYKTLLERYYRNEDIYFLAYKPDIDVNGDNQSDTNAVDAPVTFIDKGKGTATRGLTVDDIRQAFAWAKAQGTLNQALLVTIIADGEADGRLLLNSETNDFVSAPELKAILDDYQQTTGNQVVIILETSYAGTFIPGLATDENRIIIASAAADQPTQHIDSFGSGTFGWHYFNELRRGSNFWDAFHEAAGRLAQTPQLYDDNRNGRLARKMCLNACFKLQPKQTLYHNDDTIRVTLPLGLPSDKVSYIGIALPDGSAIFTLNQLNGFEAFNGSTLTPWQGEELVVELPVAADFPRGEYPLYLLRVKVGIDPLAHPELWELNIGAVTIE